MYWGVEIEAEQYKHVNYVDIKMFSITASVWDWNSNNTIRNSYLSPQ